MLTKLSIQNYALIKNISINFSDGLTTISGETGAGKSILLGGLGLILGNRADTTTLLDKQKKCIIEGEFDLSSYNVYSFFEENDLDFEDHSIIRRELLPSGKSRAFINDTPVRLNLLSDLKNALIDVHSQHQTLQLNNANFQFQIVDSIADTKDLQLTFLNKKNIYEDQISAFNILKQEIDEATTQHDYHSFLFDELVKAGFKEGEQETLEQDIERLNNIESIQQNLSESYHILADEDQGSVLKLYQIKNNLDTIKSFSDNYKKMAERLESLYIDIKDIEADLADLVEHFNSDEGNLDRINNRLQLLYSLYHKHKVADVEDLLKIQRDLSVKVANVSNASELLKEKEAEVLSSKKELFDLGKEISQRRKKVLPQLEKNLAFILHDLGMPHARFGISITQMETFYHNGIDQIQFLFTANKGGDLESIKKVASGGELSRIMLAVKSVMAKHSQLPTIIFDEIDSGISGEISLKMGEIMEQMAQTMQVVVITHLPQIAAKGKQHLKVYKTSEKQYTETDIGLLDKKQRVIEIAEMLGGKNLTETAINHAKQLLN